VLTIVCVDNGGLLHSRVTPINIYNKNLPKLTSINIYFKNNNIKIVQ